MSGRDVPLQQNETTEYAEANEQALAELLLRLQRISGRIRGITLSIDSVSAQLTQYGSHDALLSNFVATLPRVSGGSELLIQATDAEGLSVAQDVSELSDFARNLFDMAMSRLKACCDDLDEVEHETAEFLNHFETFPIDLKTALAAEEVDVPRALRYVLDEIRLNRAKILAKVRSYW